MSNFLPAAPGARPYIPVDYEGFKVCPGPAALALLAQVFQIKLAGLRPVNAAWLCACAGL